MYYLIQIISGTKAFSRSAFSCDQNVAVFLWQDDRHRNFDSDILPALGIITQSHTTDHPFTGSSALA